MTSYKQRVIDFFEIEWGTYVERTKRLPALEASHRVRVEGYDRLHDLLAHVIGWWEEGIPIVMAIAENREYARKKYDFDAFNAESMAKYKDWDEAEFLTHFEKTRQDIVTQLRSLDEAAFDHPRVRGWLRGTVIEHAREHLLVLSKFLALDTLEEEWGTYLTRFDKIEAKDTFLQKQGYTSFSHLLAHIVGWWEEGIKLTKAVLANPSFVYNEPDTNSFNAEMVAKYKETSEPDMRNLFEQTRAEMTALVRGLPESAFENQTIERWLAADVVEHYDEHAVGG